MTGPEADEFQLKVHRAAREHPWYTRTPSHLVNIIIMHMSIL